MLIISKIYYSILLFYGRICEYFCNQKGANYFEYVGQQLADKFIIAKDKMQIWID